MLDTRHNDDYGSSCSSWQNPNFMTSLYTPLYHKLHFKTTWTLPNSTVHSHVASLGLLLIWLLRYKHLFNEAVAVLLAHQGTWLPRVFMSLFSCLFSMNTFTLDLKALLLHPPFQVYRHVLPPSGTASTHCSYPRRRLLACLGLTELSQCLRPTWPLGMEDFVSVN